MWFSKSNSLTQHFCYFKTVLFIMLPRGGMVDGRISFNDIIRVLYDTVLEIIVIVIS